MGGAARSLSGVIRSFQDGLGERFLQNDPESGTVLELLRLDPLFTTVPGFAQAVAAQVRSVATFEHFAFGRIRRVDLPQSPDENIVIVSDRVPGIRLTALLRLLQHAGQAIEAPVALGLARYLLSAVEALHRHAPDAVHGALGPERIIVTPQARLVILEHALGPALRLLELHRPELWQRFRISSPPSTQLPRFDQRADVFQIGMVALALVLGRAIQPEEFPTRLGELITTATEYTGPSGRRPLSTPLRTWFLRTLQLDARWSFGSAREAGHALDRLTASQGYRVSPAAIEAFLARYQGQALAGSSPRFVSIPRPVGEAPAESGLAALPAPAPEPRRAVLRRFWKG